MVALRRDGEPPTFVYLYIQPYIQLYIYNHSKWMITRQHSHQANGNAKACPQKHHFSTNHMSNRIALLSEAPAEQPFRRALVIGETIQFQVKLGIYYGLQQ